MVSIAVRLVAQAMRWQMARFSRDISVPAIRAQTERAVLEGLQRGTTSQSATIGGVPCEWIIPLNAIPERLLIYLHGGGYVIKSPRLHRAMISRLSKVSEVRALIVDYRLAPEHPFPAALDDVIAVYNALLAEGFAPQSIVIGGDSAGGGLALALMQQLRARELPLPAGAVLISPWADLTMTGATLQTHARRDPYMRADILSRYAAYYVGSHDLRNPLISPCFADLRGFRPLLIHVGANEILLGDAQQLADSAREAGVEVDLQVWGDMFHVWHIMAKLVPEGRQAITEIGAFVRNQRHSPTKNPAP